MKTKILHRGYFGIGVFHPKHEVNIGTLWRSATLFGASFIFTIGRRYKEQASDTTKTARHIPLYTFLTFDEMKSFLPYACQVVCIEQHADARDLPAFRHPLQAAYLLGAEDHGIPEEILEDWPIIEIPTGVAHCMNVAVAGSIVMYDRFVKASAKENFI